MTRGPQVAVAAIVTLSLLLPLVTRSVPAGADPVPAATTGCSRAAALMAWEAGGPQVRRAAEKALAGAEADVCTFLESQWTQLDQADETIAANQMIARSGPTVQAAATRALDSADPAALTAFLESGWQDPAHTDSELRISQMVASGGPNLRSAAGRALDDGSDDALTSFLDQGWEQPQLADLELRINQILATGGPQVRATAQRALDRGGVETLTRFLKVDWGVAAARDHEEQTLTDLLSAAEIAGEQAEAQTKAAQTQAERAVTEAAAAKRSAEAARAAAAAAHDDRVRAEEAAARATAAADSAAAAAREAVGAAGQAAAAARQASDAAIRVSAAAAMAERKASEAYNAAAAAAGDRNAADQARDKARAARDAARIAATAEASLNQAMAAFQQAKTAATRANSAAGHAGDADAAAREAARIATAAGADASEAYAAANRARAAGLRAARAAAAAIAFAETAASEAAKARDAARSAAANAVRAAEAAEDAAEHAGEAADAAEKAAAHAEAAAAAAAAAVTAAEQAKRVFDAARQLDADRLEDAYREGLASAREAARLVARSEATPQAAADAPRIDWRSAELNAKLDEAADAQTPTTTALRLAREAALELAGSGGTFTRAAAREALAGTDADVMTFVENGLVEAEGMDDRTTLAGMISTGTQAFGKAAEQAAEGTDAQVAAFLRDPVYPERIDEDAVTVNHILARAKQVGDQHTVDTARNALDDGTPEALHQFIETGQFDARRADEEIRTNQIYASAADGSELRSAASIALEGPPAFRTQFLERGQYEAQLHDHDAAAHVASVSSLVAQTQEVARRAVQNSMEAMAAAARARGAAEEAAGYAEDALAAAADAAEQASKADAAADRAEESATQAATSADTAVRASLAAEQSADQAEQSATWAQISAAKARGFAQDAIDSANVAKEEAIAAGKSAEEAAAAFTEAIDIAYQQAISPLIVNARDATITCFRPGLPPPGYDQDCLQEIADNTVASILDPSQLAMRQGNLCDSLYDRGSDRFELCLEHVLSPTFAQDVSLDAIYYDLLVPLQALAQGELFVLANVGVLRFCLGACAELMNLLDPALIGAFPPAYFAVQEQFAVTLLAARIAAVLERTRVVVESGKIKTQLAVLEAYRLSGCLIDGGRSAGRAGRQSERAAPPTNDCKAIARNALNVMGWKPPSYDVGGGYRAHLSISAMVHIMVRHMPRYWNGKPTAIQSLFLRTQAVPDVTRGVRIVVQQNRELIWGYLSSGTGKWQQFHGKVDGVPCTLGMKPDGSIGQFFCDF